MGCSGSDAATSPAPQIAYSAVAVAVLAYSITGSIPMALRFMAPHKRLSISAGADGEGACLL